jgi:hypothetical protein
MNYEILIRDYMRNAYRQRDGEHERLMQFIRHPFVGSLVCFDITRIARIDTYHLCKSVWDHDAEQARLYREKVQQIGKPAYLTSSCIEIPVSVVQSVRDKIASLKMPIDTTASYANDGTYLEFTLGHEELVARFMWMDFSEVWHDYTDTFNEIFMLLESLNA